MRYARIFSLIVVSSLVGAAAFVPARAEPPALNESGANLGWIESYAWGGGARYLFAEPEKGRAGALRLPGGAGIEFVVGCTGANRSTSSWRFRVGATPAGSGITEASEIALGKALARLFGTPGSLVLLDAHNRETARIALSPRQDGLETVALLNDEVQAILAAFALRAESPHFRLEAGTRALASTLEAQRKLPCAGR